VHVEIRRIGGRKPCKRRDKAGKDQDAWSHESSSRHPGRLLREKPIRAPHGVNMAVHAASG